MSGMPTPASVTSPAALLRGPDGAANVDENEAGALYIAAVVA